MQNECIAHYRYCMSTVKHICFQQFWLAILSDLLLLLTAGNGNLKPSLAGLNVAADD